MADAYAIHSFGYEILTQTVSVTLPAADGWIGILARRAPLVAQLGAGRMSIRGPEGGSNEYYVAGGFAHVREGALTVLAEECTPAGSLSQEVAVHEVERARALPTETEADWERRERAMTIAKAKLRLAQEQAAAGSVQQHAQ